ncbi:hypothetical protein [Methanohalobium sp.]|uniref:hypothetical protein n=1 Tax=Methanohalobium sp. TaxID=2837493 RepID=UPI0025F3DC0E|nr:hypothetical protein [Methanohalobium sp.]
MTGIKSKNGLIDQIKKNYWMEADMEQLVIWETRIKLKGDEKESLDTLAYESEEHKFLLEKWIEIMNLSIPETRPRGIPEENFDFSNLDSPQMFDVIQNYEIILRDSYTDLRDIDEPVLKKLIPDESYIDDFRSDMGELVSEEQNHINICQSQIGGFKSIYG